MPKKEKGEKSKINPIKQKICKYFTLKKIKIKFCKSEKNVVGPKHLLVWAYDVTE